MVRAYGQAWARIHQHLAALTTKIDEATAAGQPLGLSWLFQQGRLEGLLAQTEAELNRFAAHASWAVKQEQLKAVSAAGQHAEELTKAAAAPGVADSWATLPTDALEHLVGFMGDGSPLAALFGTLAPDAAAGVKKALVTGVATGKNPRDIAEAAKQHLGGNLARALTIARTETLRSYREATRLSYAHNDDVVGGWVWISACDARTCPSCWAMHGTTHPLGERLDDHPCGRCTMAPITRSYEDILAGVGKGAEGAAADTLSPALHIKTGADRFAALEASTQQQILGPAKFALYASGQIELPDVVQQTDHGPWGTMRSEASVATALANAAARKAAAAAAAASAKAKARLLAAIAAHADAVQAQAAAAQLEADQAGQAATDAKSAAAAQHKAAAGSAFPNGTAVKANAGKHAGKLGTVTKQAGGFVKVDFGDGPHQTVWKGQLEPLGAAPAPTAKTVSTTNGSDVLAVLGKHAGKKGTVVAQAGGFVKVDFGDGPVTVWKAHLAHPSADAAAAAAEAQAKAKEWSKSAAKLAQAKANAAPVTTQKAQPAPVPGLVDVDAIAKEAVADAKNLASAKMTAGDSAWTASLQAGIAGAEANGKVAEAVSLAEEYWLAAHPAPPPIAAPPPPPPPEPVPPHVAAAAAQLVGPLEDVLAGLEAGGSLEGPAVGYETAKPLQEAVQAFVDDVLNGQAPLADFKPVVAALKDVVGKAPADFAALDALDLSAHLDQVAEDLDAGKAQAALAELKAMAAAHPQASTPAPQPTGLPAQGPLFGQDVTVAKGKKAAEFAGLVGKVVKHETAGGADLAHVYFPQTGKTAKIIAPNLAVVGPAPAAAPVAPVAAPEPQPTPSTAAAPEPAPAAKKATKRPAVEPVLPPRVPPVELGTLVADQAEGGLPGAHAKTVYRAPDGSLWLFKPQESFRAELDAAMGHLADVAGFKATPSDVFNVELHGQRGSLQRMLGTKDTRRAAFGKHGAFDATKIDADDAERLQQHAVWNWMVGNHDGHADQFVRLKGDRAVHQVDQGQAFRFFGKDKLDQTYSPNPVTVVANELYGAYAKGKDVPLRTLGEGNGQLKAFIGQLQGIPDATYRAVLRPYAEQAAAARQLAVGSTFANDVDRFLDAAVARKNGLLDDWTAYHARLDKAREKVGDQVPRGTDAHSRDAVDFTAEGNTAATRYMARKWPTIANAGITPDEQAALRSYKGAGYDAMNRRMRQGGEPTPSIKYIDQALAKNPFPEDTIVWRGVGADALRHKPDEYVGRAIPYYDAGFMSTSLGSDPAFSSRPVWMRIRVPKGTPTYYLEHITGMGERELLLPRGAQFRVERVWTHANGKTVLDLKLEAHGQPPPAV